MDMEQRIEQREKAIYDIIGNVHIGFVESARRIARAELKREGRLVEGVERARMLLHTSSEAYAVLTNVQAAYEAEFAPKVRTLREVAADIDKTTSPQIPFATSHVQEPQLTVPLRLVNELAAALKREGGA